MNRLKLDTPELRRAAIDTGEQSCGSDDLHPEERLALWRALARGACARIDEFETESHRFIVASLAKPVAARGLSARERSVVRGAARGLSDKAIAFELRVAKSTVSTLLRRALRKLGLGRLDLSRIDWSDGPGPSSK